MTTKLSSTSSSEAEPGQARAFLRDACAFAAVTLAVFMAANVGADHVIDTELERKYQAVFSRDAMPQGMVLGSSKALYAIRPRDLAPLGDYFNFAIASADPAYLAWWWSLYRAHHPAPEVVLLGIDWAHLSVFPHRAREIDSEFWPWPMFGMALIEPGADVRKLLLNRFPLVKDRLVLRDALLGKRRLGTSEMSRYDRGWVPIDDRSPNLTQKPWRSITVVADRVRELETLVGRIHGDGARLVLFQTPEYRPLSRHHPEANAVIARVAAGVGVPFLDYNGDRASALNENVGHYRDWQHMTEAGAAAFGPVFRRDVAAALSGPRSTGASGRRPGKPPHRRPGAW